MDDLPETQTQEDYVVIDATQEELTVKTPWGRLNACLPTLLSIDLFEPMYTFGRAPLCNIFIEKSQFPAILNVSKEHFRISRVDELVYVTDLSKNGTFVNETKIGKNNRHIIHNGDIIAIGHPNSRVYNYITFNNDHYDYPLGMQARYFISRKLGRGAFGEVRLAHDKKTFKKYAVKKICKSRSSSNVGGQNPQKIATEIEILTTFSHPFIIQMVEVFDSDREVFLLLEYMEGGELTSRIMSSIPFPESEVKYVFYQILQAVRFLHMNGVTHRDLKPENILLVSNDTYPMIKVSDFGLSKILEGVSVMDTTCGTIHYAAPEILSSTDSYNRKVDIWSMGVILFYMLSKTQPFLGDDRDEVARKIVKGRIDWHSRMWKNVTDSAKDLTRKMLTVDPAKRLSVSDVFKQDWIEKDVAMQYKVQQLTAHTFEDSEGSSDDLFAVPSKRPRLVKTM